MSPFEDILRAELRPYLASRAVCDLGADELAQTVLEIVNRALQKSECVVIPVRPSKGLLVSMAMRFDHAFGMNAVPDNGFSLGGMGYTPEQRRSMLTSMNQIHEEVVGHGFYQPDREERYCRVLAEGGNP